MLFQTLINCIHVWHCKNLRNHRFTQFCSLLLSLQGRTHADYVYTIHMLNCTTSCYTPAEMLQAQTQVRNQPLITSAEKSPQRLSGPYNCTVLHPTVRLYGRRTHCTVFRPAHCTVFHPALFNCEMKSFRAPNAGQSEPCTSSKSLLPSGTLRWRICETVPCPNSRHFISLIDSVNIH